jgi:hypothetical protein
VSEHREVGATNGRYLQAINPKIIKISLRDGPTPPNFPKLDKEQTMGKTAPLKKKGSE